MKRLFVFVVFGIATTVAGMALKAADGPILAVPQNAGPTIGDPAGNASPTLSDVKPHSVMKPADSQAPAAGPSVTIPMPEQIQPSTPKSVMPQSSVVPANPSIITPANPSGPSVVIDIPGIQSTPVIGADYSPGVKYRDKGLRKRCHDPSTDVATVLLVKNPRTDCVACIPVCIPCGCLTPVCISDRNALFCRGIVNYNYGNGFRIQMIFDAKGDVKVVYHYV